MTSRGMTGEMFERVGECSVDPLLCNLKIITGGKRCIFTMTVHRFSGITSLLVPKFIKYSASARIFGFGFFLSGVAKPSSVQQRTSHFCFPRLSLLLLCSLATGLVARSHHFHRKSRPNADPPAPSRRVKRISRWPFTPPRTPAGVASALLPFCMHHAGERGFLWLFSLIFLDRSWRYDMSMYVHARVFLSRNKHSRSKRAE